MLKGRHLVEPRDFDLAETDGIFETCDRIIADPWRWRDVCRGKVLATLFFEPSTRTRLSFEAAMLRLGGGVTGFAEPQCSSAAKGESLADTIRTVAAYADAIVMRNPKEGSALFASRCSCVPFINAGDGSHHHPTQTLTDLATIRALKGGCGGLTIGLCGDLRFGRTVHSLVKALSRYPGNRFVFISPRELTMPDYLTRDILAAEGIEYRETDRLEEAMGELDILYMTRIQKERFLDVEEYERLKDAYLLDAAKLARAKADMIILHPLPRVHEIAPEVDSDPRAAYFAQVKYGMYVRMALLASLLGVAA